ncbi:MAG: phosphoesterase, partial [Actinomycetota bacterium]|nr:phosphoesterase [Actinomycetota bacterium]
MLESLVECLRTLVASTDTPEPPRLILDGDILELALAEDNVAAMVFDRFIDLAYTPTPLFHHEISYLPGNHDHHIWETARERQYADYVASVSSDTPLGPPWHSTRLFERPGAAPLEAELLTALVKRRPGPADRVGIQYPNLGLFSSDRQRAVIVHHGHFVEPIYRVMSTLRTAIFPRSGAGLEIWDW